MSFLREWISEWKDVFEPNRPLKDRLRDLLNALDTPIDDLKHKIHGARIFGRTIYLPKWLMRNKG